MTIADNELKILHLIKFGLITLLRKLTLKRAVATALLTLKRLNFGGQSFDRIHFDTVNINSNQVKKIILALNSKSSSIDFIPTFLLKSCSIIFSEIICKLAKLSFSSGVFRIFSRRLLSPLLKKPKLDPYLPSSYRPISNPNNISKILERLFLISFSPHVVNCPAFYPVQSAYRSHHSTETALLHTFNHIFSDSDQSRPTLLILLDSIDHVQLMTRLD